MKKTIILFFAAFIFLCAFSVISDAQVTIGPRRHHHHDRINHRQSNQQRRIARGVNNGRLTAGETTRLERREARINRTERKYRTSGNGLSKSEKRRLNRRLNNLSHDIHRQKHDRQHQ